MTLDQLDLLVLKATLDRLEPTDLLDPKVQREILETLGLPELTVRQALTAFKGHPESRVQ